MGAGKVGTVSSFTTYTPTDNPAGQNFGSTSVPFGGVNIGVANAAREVIVIVNTTANVATGVSVGAVALTKRIDEATSISGLQMWSGNVPSGTSATVTLTSAANMQNEIIQVGYFNAGASTTPITGVRSPTGVVTTTSLSLVACPASGFSVIAFYTNGATTSPVWTNTTAGAGDYATTQQGTLFSSHSLATGSQTFNFSWTTGSTIHGIGACWGP